MCRAVEGCPLLRGDGEGALDQVPSEWSERFRRLAPWWYTGRHRGRPRWNIGMTPALVVGEGCSTGMRRPSCTGGSWWQLAVGQPALGSKKQQQKKTSRPGSALISRNMVFPTSKAPWWSARWRRVNVLIPEANSGTERARPSGA